MRDLGVFADKAAGHVPLENAHAGCLLSAVDPGPASGAHFLG
jgi:hypothetical protein